MDKIFQHQLKNGEIIMFMTDMTNEEVMKLPTLANQYEFRKYFSERGNQLDIFRVVKQPFFRID